VGVADGKGELTLTSSDGPRQGEVETADVDDDGELTAEGTITKANATALDQTFELSGTCQAP
jgi:hypothetical protein